MRGTFVTTDHWDWDLDETSGTNSANRKEDEGEGKKGTHRCRPRPSPRSRLLAPQGGGGRARSRVAAHRRPRTPFSCLLGARAALRLAVGAIAIAAIGVAIGVVRMGRMPWRGALLDRRVCHNTVLYGDVPGFGGGGDADVDNGQ